MGEHDDSYGTIIRAVNGRWRRRFLFLAHAIVYGVAALQTVDAVVQNYSFFNPQTNLNETYSYTQYTQLGGTFAGQVWLALLALHLVYAVFAELRDRAVRREVERERQWRLREWQERAATDEQERAARLTDDGELIDYDPAGWASQGKRKRG